MQILLRRSIAGLLALILAGLAPGFEASHAFAATITGPRGIPVNGAPIITAVPFSAGAPTLNAPALSPSFNSLNVAPGLLSAPGLTPSIIPTLTPAPVGSAEVPVTSQGLLEASAQQLEAAHGNSDRASILTSLFTGSSRKLGDIADLSGQANAPTPLQPSVAAAPAASNEELQATASDAAQPAAKRTEAISQLATRGPVAHPALQAVAASNPQGNAAEYEIKRTALKALADQGLILSMPAISQAHAAEILTSLAAERPALVAVSALNPISAEIGQNLQAAANSGVQTALISNLSGEIATLNLTAPQKLTLAVANRGSVLIFDKVGNAQTAVTVSNPIEPLALLSKNSQRIERLQDVVRIAPKALQPTASKLVKLLPSSSIEASKTLIIGDSVLALGAPGALTLSVNGYADPRVARSFVWPTQGEAAAKEILAAVAKPAVEGADGFQKKAIIGMFSQRTASIVAFLLTAIAYPFIAIPVVGVPLFGALMALGPLAAIATGPLNGLIAKKLSARNAMAVNTVVRIVLSLALPAFAGLGALNFATLLVASVANGWLLSSIMTTESIYFKRFSGKRLGSMNALSMLNYLAVQAILGLIIGVGSYVGHWDPMLPYYISAAVHAVIVLPIIWKTIPNVVEGAVQAPPKVKVSFSESAKSKASALKDFAKKYWKEAVLFAGAAALFPVVHTVLPAILALVYGLSRTQGFKDLWAQKSLRYAVLAVSLAAFIFYPLQSFSLPLIAQALAGAAGKTLLLGQLMGALFFGQLISGSSQAKLSELRLPFLGRFGAQRLVQAAVLALGSTWVYMGLFPGNILASIAAAVIGAALMAVSEKLTNRGWIRFFGVGLAAILLPLLSWGSVPLLFVSMLTLGFFYGPAFVALTSYFFSRVPKDKADSMIAIQGSLFNAAISLGFAVTSLLVGLFTPAFPAVLIPIGIAAVVAGILFAFVPKLLPGLADSLFNHKKK
mgnify:CR=1 FL=1